MVLLGDFCSQSASSTAALYRKSTVSGCQVVPRLGKGLSGTEAERAPCVSLLLDEKTRKIVHILLSMQLSGGAANGKTLFAPIKTILTYKG